MAITDQLILDLSQALAQLDDLERQLDSLLQPIVVPVEVESDQSLSQLQRDIRQVDNENIDIDVDVDGISRAEREFDDLEDGIEDVADELRRVEREADDATNAVLRVGTRGASVFTNLRGSLIGVAAGFAAFQAGGALFDFFDDSIQAASDLEESTSKAQVVFGGFFDDIQAFANTAPQALGLANQEALEFTGTFGNLFTALGLTQSAAADLAPDIVQLGADLASFNNLEVTDALDKLRAGLVGEAEPLRALGVNLNAAAVEAKALELGLQDSTGVVDDAAKVQARYALILEQTSTAQGDFARTADSIANRQRTLAAGFEQTQAAIGEALLPAFEALLDLTPALIEGLNNLTPAIATFAEQLGNLAEDGDGAVTFLADLPRGFAGLADVVGGAIGTVTTPVEALFSLFQEGTDPIDQFVEGFRTLGDVSDNIEIRVIEQDVIDALRDGIGPLDAFGNALVRLQEGSTLTADSIERFASITGATEADQRDVILTLLSMGDAAGFTAAELEALRVVLISLRGSSDLPLNEVSDDIKAAAAAAAAAGPSFGELGEASDDLARQIQQLENVDLSEAVDDIGAQFDRLPDQLDAAAAALRTEENEIVEDFSVFVDQLDDEIAARAAFRANIDILEAFGLDQLAEVFRQEGLEAAAALADAVANPEEAARAEALLDAEAAQIAASFRSTLAAEIQSGALDLTVPVNINAAIQSLTSSGLSSLEAVQVVGAAGAGPNIGGGVTVNQTINGPVPDTPTMVRAAQTANSVINAR